jgi:prepilin-type N-terminal cleavage/methylation domain-containing protein
MRNNLKPLNYKLGFTMIEAMTVIAIISIVSSIVMPAIDNFYSGNKVQANASMLVNDIRLARYKSIEDQIPHRIVFQIDGSEYVGYKVETFTGFDDDGNGTADFDGTDDGTLEEDYDKDTWESILSEEEMFFDPGLRIISKGLPECIFFWPNGQLVTRPDKSDTISDSNIIPIPECYLTFGHSNAGIRILINAYGVFASEAYQPDEDSDTYQPDNDEDYTDDDEIW